MHRSESRRVFPTACRIVQTPLLAKRRRQLFASLLVALLLGANSQAQDQAQAQVQAGERASDWQVVKNLLRGTRIAVKTQHHYRCWAENVTDDELVCEAHTPLKAVTLVIRRSEIREIRILPHPNQTKDMWIGGGIGAGAGAIAAGTRGGNYPGVDAFFGGLAGVLPGVIVGGIVPVFQVMFQRGKIIYKR
ncbi:MAG TPA: hypothetical protein VGR55_09795 [Candidatus Acidoferrum sp.]|nr:hypothetical protein [Candidatus Acidoferrum sp.]